jgi:putative protease
VYVEEEKRPGKLLKVEEDETGSFLFSSKDLCTIDH